jgi:hypothetical protein
MKTLTLSIALVIGFSCIGFAQSEKLQSGDSIRVELQRAVISKELTQLRDSIANSLHVFDSLIEKSQGKKRDKLLSAKRELEHYQDLVKLDIEETNTTARKAWLEINVERMKANTVTTRREYKRIRAIK